MTVEDQLATTMRYTTDGYMSRAEALYLAGSRQFFKPSDNFLWPRPIRDEDQGSAPIRGRQLVCAWDREISAIIAWLVS